MPVAFPFLLSITFVLWRNFHPHPVPGDGVWLWGGECEGAGPLMNSARRGDYGTATLMIVNEKLFSLHTASIPLSRRPNGSF